MNKLRNALANTITMFFMIGSVSAILAVFIHSVIYMPAWTSFIVGSCGLLFITMVVLEYSTENNND